MCCLAHLFSGKRKTITYLTLLLKPYKTCLMAKWFIILYMKHILIVQISIIIRKLSTSVLATLIPSFYILESQEPKPQRTVSDSFRRWELGVKPKTLHILFILEVYFSLRAHSSCLFEILEFCGSQEQVNFCAVEAKFFRHN